MKELFLLQVFSRGTQGVLYPSLVGLVSIYQRTSLMGNRMNHLEVVHSSINMIIRISKEVTNLFELVFKLYSYNGDSTYSEEFSGIFITVIDSDGSSANTNVEANSEVEWLEWHAGAVLLNH